MKVTAEQLSKMDSNVLKFVSGDLSVEASKPLAPELNPVGGITLASTLERFELALKSKATIIVAIKKAIPAKFELGSGRALFEATGLNAALALINPFFDDKLTRFPKEIHKTTVISPSARLGKNVRIGPFAVIGDNVVISDEAIIGPHCVLEKNAKIGSKTILHAQVFIGAECEIGNNCELHPHVTIGSDGFGFQPQENKAPIKVPQIGKVILEDDVEIGGNCVIDRASLNETRICKGTKFDNLVHIAHNCKIGPNSLIAAGFMTAGSSTIGSNFSCGGGVVVSDHLEITDNVTLAGKSVATNDIKEPGAYGGYPLVPLKQAMKYLATLPHLPEMRKQLHEIKKHLGIKED